MQVSGNTSKRRFSRSTKLSILRELSSGTLSHSDLARKYQIHPVTLYHWKRTMTQKKEEPQAVDLLEMAKELERLRKENENLKMALAEVAVEKQILLTANDILKKDQRDQKLRSQRKRSKS